MHDDITARMNLGLAAAREAGALLQSYRSRPVEVFHKGRLDLVTEADRAAERLITLRISDVFPDDGILAEEGTTLEGKSGVRWIVDPLDGTTNFAHGFPVYAVSIGVEREGVMVFGVVYDPSRDELFEAHIKGGASLNGKPLAVSATGYLEESLLVTGFPYDIRESAANNLDHFERFSVSARAVRRTGSAALDLCYVAAGRFDGFWELKLRPWDTAAGSLMVLEAGGRVTDFDGNVHLPISDKIVASNGRIHRAMIEILQAGGGRG